MSWGQVQLTCPLTHSLVTRGGPFLPMDGVIEQSCGCPGTRVGGGVQLDVRRWDLQGAVAGALLSLKLGACFLQSVRRGGNSCLSWATVAVKHKLSLCSWGTLGVFPVEKKTVPRFIPPIHTRFIPRFIPFCCHLQPRASCALGSTSEAMPPKSSEDTKLKEKHCRNQLAALFAEVREKVGSEGLLRCIKRDTVHHL